MGRPVAAPEVRPCAFDGCAVIVKNRLGFCPPHHLIAYPCSFDAACPYRCAAHSRTRLCQEHKWFAYKLRVDWLAARFEAECEE